MTGRAILGDKHLHEGGLACPRVAHDGHKFLGFHAETDVIEGDGLVGVDFGDFVVINHYLSIIS
jgi:hypothetical protein